MNNILESLTSKDIIIPEYLDEYKEGIGFFYSELITLNTNIFIINKIRKFPFDLFCNPDDCTFFHMVINNFFEYSLIIITRIFKDTGKDCFTLPKFINKIISKYIKSEYRKLFIQRVKNVNFNNLTADILNRIHDLRKKRLAHNLEEYITETKNIGRINYNELEKLRDYSNQLFENLSFGITHMMVPLPYCEKVIHPKGYDSRPDIEKILDAIAKDSYFINAPEIDKYWLDYGKNRMSEHDLNIFYEYREKFGLPNDIF